MAIDELGGPQAQFTYQTENFPITNTGGPSLTWFSLPRIALPRLLAFVLVSGGIFTLVSDSDFYFGHFRYTS